MSNGSGSATNTGFTNMSELDTFYAYGRDNVGLEAIMRLQAVKRWHMIDTTRQQTLAEHTANVGMLAYWIAHNTPGLWFGPSVYVLKHAMLHDMGEVFVGDIPSHTKRFLTGVDELESRTLPVDFHDDNAGDPIKLLVKMCDLADGIRFIRLHGVDVTARHAQQGLERQVQARNEQAIRHNWPEIVLKFVRETTLFYAYEHS